MATKDDQETLRLLVQYVSRAFYEPKYTIIMDQLARHPVLKDDDLAGRMGLQPKELNKVIAVLSNDSLVKIYRQNELKEGAQRSVGKQYYYIDYEHFCNVVKWKISKMRSLIDSTLRNELDNKGYICPQCKQSYTPLEVDRLMDFARSVFLCEICHAEVVDNENAESVQGSKDRMQRFNQQMRFIREGLQKSEAMVLPHFDVAAWVKANPTSSNVSHPSSNNSNANTNTSLKVAGASGTNQHLDDGVGIMLAMDKDESTRKAERDAEAEVKRQQNALPAWHLKSTITGDLTALGVKERGRVEGLGAQPVVENDDLLKGLGISGPRQVNNHASSLVAGSSSSFYGAQEIDVKPPVNHEADLYDQYYASLAAASSSTQPTPTFTGRSGSSPPQSQLFEDDDDGEEDKKPNIEYLDSLNAYRKRSRSAEDVGGRGGKVPKVNGNGLVNGGGYGFGHQPEDTPMQEDPDLPVEEEGGYGAGGVQDDPVVLVNGNPKPYSQVTEEDHDLMTPDEYTAYFEVMQTRS